MEAYGTRCVLEAAGPQPGLGHPTTTMPTAPSARRGRPAPSGGPSPQRAPRGAPGGAAERLRRPGSLSRAPPQRPQIPPFPSSRRQARSRRAVSAAAPALRPRAPSAPRRPPPRTAPAGRAGLGLRAAAPELPGAAETKGRERAAAAAAQGAGLGGMRATMKGWVSASSSAAARELPAAAAAAAAAARRTTL